MHFGLWVSLDHKHGCLGGSTELIARIRLESTVGVAKMEVVQELYRLENGRDMQETISVTYDFAQLESSQLYSLPLQFMSLDYYNRLILTCYSSFEKV